MEGSLLQIPGTHWLRRILSAGSLLLTCCIALWLVHLLISGLPTTLPGGYPVPLKSLRKPFLALLFSMGVYLVSGGKERMGKAIATFERATENRFAIWSLFAVYSLLFIWQQITEYLSVEINFLPFSFYDYMLYFLFQGKINYTGHLHGFYHLNNILLLLAPLWYLFRSSFFLVVFHGVLLAAGVLPLYYLAAERFGKIFAWVVAFVYLNHRLLLNLLTMNFTAESFYPLLIFLAILFLNKNLPLYYFSIFLGLMVKEDSFLYFSAWGVYLMLFTRTKREGLLTLVLSLAYITLAVKFFVPWTQGVKDSILEGSIRNFSRFGDSISEIAFTFVERPWLLVQELFYPWEKLRTLFKILSRFLLIPCLSPSLLLVFASVFPLFLNGGENFVGLRFHYSAPVIPLLFFAFLEGLSFLRSHFRMCEQKSFLLALGLALVLLHSGNFYTQRILNEDLRTISFLRSKKIPTEAVVLTHGHLLPYLGYRRDNYYLSWHFEQGKERYPSYHSPDYVYLDLSVNPYPMSEAFVKERIAHLRSKGSRYHMKHQDGTRFFFVRLPVKESKQNGQASLK